MRNTGRSVVEGKQVKQYQEQKYTKRRCPPFVLIAIWQNGRVSLRKRNPCEGLVELNEENAVQSVDESDIFDATVLSALL